MASKPPTLLDTLSTLVRRHPKLAAGVALQAGMLIGAAVRSSLPKPGPSSRTIEGRQANLVGGKAQANGDDGPRTGRKVATRGSASRGKTSRGKSASAKSSRGKGRSAKARSGAAANSAA